MLCICGVCACVIASVRKRGRGGGGGGAESSNMIYTNEPSRKKIPLLLLLLLLLLMCGHFKVNIRVQLGVKHQQLAVRLLIIIEMISEAEVRSSRVCDDINESKSYNSCLHYLRGSCKGVLSLEQQLAGQPRRLYREVTRVFDFRNWTHLCFMHRDTQICLCLEDSVSALAMNGKALAWAIISHMSDTFSCWTWSAGCVSSLNCQCLH